MKTCPVCKSKCFDDMQVCFGCLHKFDDNGPQASCEAVSDSARGIHPDDLDEAIAPANSAMMGWGRGEMPSPCASAIFAHSRSTAPLEADEGRGKHSKASRCYIWPSDAFASVCVDAPTPTESAVKVSTGGVAIDVPAGAALKIAFEMLA